MLPLHESL